MALRLLLLSLQALLHAQRQVEVAEQQLREENLRAEKAVGPETEAGPPSPMYEAPKGGAGHCWSLYLLLHACMLLFVAFLLLLQEMQASRAPPPSPAGLGAPASQRLLEETAELNRRVDEGAEEKDKWGFLAACLR